MFSRLVVFFDIFDEGKVFVGGIMLFKLGEIILEIIGEFIFGKLVFGSDKLWFRVFNIVLVVFVGSMGNLFGFVNLERIGNLLVIVCCCRWCVL